MTLLAALIGGWLTWDQGDRVLSAELGRLEDILLNGGQACLQCQLNRP